jgi:hypothetical protein
MFFRDFIFPYLIHFTVATEAVIHNEFMSLRSNVHVESYIKFDFIGCFFLLCILTSSVIYVCGVIIFWSQIQNPKYP